MIDARQLAHKNSQRTNALRESSATLQSGQWVSEMGNNCPRRSLVGRIFQAIFHKNNLSRSFKIQFPDGLPESGGNRTGSGSGGGNKTVY
jgi:hypothetical protein